jgi:hypothetical protein
MEDLADKDLSKKEIVALLQKHGTDDVSKARIGVEYIFLIVRCFQWLKANKLAGKAANVAKRAKKNDLMNLYAKLYAEKEGGGGRLRLTRRNKRRMRRSRTQLRKRKKRPQRMPRRQKQRRCQHRKQPRRLRSR